jgi:DNA-directed RNA polymerase subunit RPC12/RpoP
MAQSVRAAGNRGGREEVQMASIAVATYVDARCPLCGSPILAIGRSGRVLAEDLHAIPLYNKSRAEGYMVCEECGLLAEMSPDITLN